MSLSSLIIALASLVATVLPFGLLVALLGVVAYAAFAIATKTPVSKGIVKKEVKDRAAQPTAARKLGSRREPVVVVLLKVCSLSIYHFIWHYSVLEEMRRFRGKGTSGGTYVGAMALGFCVCLPMIPALAFVFHTPALIGAMYREAGLRPPVTGLTGFWTFIPVLGGIVWLFKVQGALNSFWFRERKRLAEAA